MSVSITFEIGLGSVVGLGALEMKEKQMAFPLKTKWSLKLSSMRN